MSSSSASYFVLMMIDDKKTSLGGSSSKPRTFPMLHLLLNLLLFLLLAFFFASSGHAACDQNDLDSLLAFYSNITLPSSSPLNWSASIDCCFWEEINCDASDDSRVTQLWLPSRGLSGHLSPSLLNLTHLTHLNLSHNRFTGSLPTGFFTSLNQLQVLDLSYNILYGELPLDFFADGNNNLSPIQTVDLSSNHFSGTIQSNSFLQAAQNLIIFNVSNNTLTGQVPSSICLNTSLTVLDLSYNKLNGEIPRGIENCSKLQIFRAGFNNLSGTLPVGIFTATSLQQLSLPLNHLSGRIQDGIVQLADLTILELSSNDFEGPIPKNIGQLSKLEHLLLHINNFTGSLPPSLMNCTNLITLNLRVNNLEGDLSTFNFSTLQRLNTLDLGNNSFTGTLPLSLYYCKSLTAIRLASNQLEGQISPDILALRSLSYLSISTNKLTNFAGAIRILTGFKNLTTLILSKNFMNEEIPNDGNIVGGEGFQNLQILALGGCNFTGQIPNWLAKLNNLEVLDLSQNRITGLIPSWLGSLQNLFYIDMSDNFLTGKFPEELTSLSALATQETNDEVNGTYLELPVFVMPNNATNQQLYKQLSSLPPAIYLRNNRLSGNIPKAIGQLKFLHVLDLSQNDFSGSIPDQISNLTNLEILDLSDNHLSGQIPASLRGLHFLSSFSVAYNDLQGPIPSGGQFDTFPSSSFEGNPGLCGSVVQRICPNAPGIVHSTTTPKSINTKLIIGLVIGICFGTGLVITVLALWILSKRRIIPGGDPDKIELDTFSSNSYSGVPPPTDKDASLVMLFPNNTNEVKDLTILELLKATDNFNQENIIGCGGFGLVYKAILADGTKLAVKKLSGDFGLMEREFKAEVEALSTAQHENLVSLQGFCVHEGFRLLIYSYMENGSLDYWLHEKADGPTHLDWQTRLKIARGASNGLAYMHQICEPHIIHRDIKSSNILLDDKFEAHVADFGLSRLILPYHTHVTTELVGTLGYIPPEYGQAWVATLRGDVYSFGVVMLELVTGKRPMDMSRPKTSRELVAWVQKMRSEGKQDEVFDALLKGKGYDEEMLQVLDVGCLCINQNPFKRPTIKEVVDWLNNVGTTIRNQNKD
ncbi:tyrosine-sulfated glycopeptide receptor 1-like [Durio zibethinus]|uniref:non-specific serine/threonine protein kinase n=1 Tax=Durio zibethinus TaxID=66656 RepID=A0A6P5WF59_DURZI|nr:tyrosine-sulfated glycopeptide receptor 1-like [Durio zibethinus]